LVDVIWHGHCCFEVKGEEITIITDPHDGESLGLPVPVAEPDAVLISHHHDDHANGRKLFEEPGVRVLDSPCHESVRGADITGVKAYHDPEKGERLGPNVFFAFQVDGIRFSHTGDLGHTLDHERLAEIGGVDILFSGIGASSQPNIELLRPRVVIPMHYHVEGIIFPWFRMPDVDDYVRGRPHLKLEGNARTYSKEGLRGQLEYHVFKLM